MANIEVTIATEDLMLLDAFSDWVERNSIEYTRIYDGDFSFKIDGEDFNDFIYKYFFIKVDA